MNRALRTTAAALALALAALAPVPARAASGDTCKQGGLSPCTPYQVWYSDGTYDYQCSDRNGNVTRPCSKIIRSVNANPAGGCTC